MLGNFREKMNYFHRNTIRLKYPDKFHRLPSDFFQGLKGNFMADLNNYNKGINSTNSTVSRVNKYKRRYTDQMQICIQEIPTLKKSHRRCSTKKLVLKNFAIFTGKYLCWCLFLTAASDCKKYNVFM